MQVYLITNLLNGKKYVGQTTIDLALRFRRHCWASEYKKNMPVGLAIKKYGKRNFSIVSLETCRNQRHLNEREKYWAQELDTFSPNGYNLKAGNGQGAMSEETKRKIALANTGKRASEQTKQKLSKSHLGYRVSDSTKRKLSKINKGKIPSLATRLGASLKNSKTYVIVSPSGETLTVTNMKQFCLKNQLQPTNMCSMLGGKIPSYKGWKRANV